MGQGEGKPPPAYAIQHRYAHIGSVMAEQGLTGPVIGVAFDGTGYGTDGHLWGGEYLVAGIDGFERAGQLKYIPLPGGEAAIREPWRTAKSYIADSAGSDTEGLLKTAGFMDRYGKNSVDQVRKIAASRDLSPLSSGAGRLFDAVSAMLGVCDVNTFQGEAAMALESLVQSGIEGVGEEAQCRHREAPRAAGRVAGLESEDVFGALRGPICRGGIEVGCPIRTGRGIVGQRSKGALDRGY